MDGYRRDQVKSLKLMSESQAALLRRHFADRIHERDSLAEAALTLLAGKPGAADNNNHNRNDSIIKNRVYCAKCGEEHIAMDSSDSEALQELRDWQKRLIEEFQDLDPTDVIVNDRLRDELKHLRRQCRLQAHELEELQLVQDAKEHDNNDLRRKLRRAEGQHAKILKLLRDVRDELATRDIEDGGDVSREDHEHLRQKYAFAKAKIKLLKREAEAIGTLSSTTREADLYISGDGAELSALPPRPPRARSLDGRATFDNITAGDNVDGHRGQRAGTTCPALRTNEGDKTRDNHDADMRNALKDHHEPVTFGETDGQVVGTCLSERDGGDDTEPENVHNATVSAGGTAMAAKQTVTTPTIMKMGKRDEEWLSLRLEVEKANGCAEQAAQGKITAEKETADLFLAMGKVQKERKEIEASKDTQILATRGKLQRMMAKQHAGQMAVRNLAKRVASERRALLYLAADVKKQLGVLPAVANAAVVALQSRLGGIDDDLKEMRARYTREARERRRLFNVVQELRGNIRVFCRCRPTTSHDRGGTMCASFPREGGIDLVNERGKKRSWTFDQMFGPDANQEAVYAEVSPLVISVLDGYNACIFAYGQTGTGKTYTMMGPPEDRGVNARALEELFSRSGRRRGEVDDVITMSILEIYNEQIRDLLIEDAKGEQRKLEVRQGERGNGVPGLTTLAVSTLIEVLRLLALADKNRASSCTNLNDHSSRSHLIVSVNVHGVNRHTRSTSAGRLHLIDLAGSERISKSGAAGQALREAQNINRSLSALGDVISARASRQSHVPYRNSTLTYLLQDSLSSDSKTLMLVCVSPVIQSAEESSCSLNFAARVRTVKLGKTHKHGGAAASLEASYVLGLGRTSSLNPVSNRPERASGKPCSLTGVDKARRGGGGVRSYTHV